MPRRASFGADAVHPGYGFLAERAPFAQPVIDAGLIFVGPDARRDRRDGREERSETARARGTACRSSQATTATINHRARCEREARALGVPLVIKAVAGGGGRGMRVVGDLRRLRRSARGGASARRWRPSATARSSSNATSSVRATSSFRSSPTRTARRASGRARLLDPAPASEVVEEAPSPALDPALRARMGAAAIAIARGAGYTNAGTVEFLLAADGTFAFSR